MVTSLLIPFCILAVLQCTLVLTLSFLRLLQTEVFVYKKQLNTTGESFSEIEHAVLFRCFIDFERGGRVW